MGRRFKEMPTEFGLENILKKKCVSRTRITLKNNSEEEFYDVLLGAEKFLKVFSNVGIY
jgi:hypothetical protein